MPHVGLLGVLLVSFVFSKGGNYMQQSLVCALQTCTNVLIISCCSPACSKVPTALACVLWLRHSLQDLRDIGRPIVFASLQMVPHTLAWAVHIAF